jgi:hypothetical protein
MAQCCTLQNENSFSVLDTDILVTEIDLEARIVELSTPITNLVFQESRPSSKAEDDEIYLVWPVYTREKTLGFITDTEILPLTVFKVTQHYNEDTRKFSLTIDANEQFTTQGSQLLLKTPISEVESFLELSESLELLSFMHNDFKVTEPNTAILVRWPTKDIRKLSESLQISYIPKLVEELAIVTELCNAICDRQLVPENAQKIFREILKLHFEKKTATGLVVAGTLDDSTRVWCQKLGINLCTVDDSTVLDVIGERIFNTETVSTRVSKIKQQKLLMTFQLLSDVSKSTLQQDIRTAEIIQRDLTKIKTLPQAALRVKNYLTKLQQQPRIIESQIWSAKSLKNPASLKVILRRLRDAQQFILKAKEKLRHTDKDSAISKIQSRCRVDRTALAKKIVEAISRNLEPSTTSDPKILEQFAQIFEALSLCGWQTLTDRDRKTAHTTTKTVHQLLPVVHVSDTRSLIDVYAKLQQIGQYRLLICDTQIQDAIEQKICKNLESHA